MYVDTKLEIEWKSISTIILISMGVRSLKSSFIMVVALAEMFVVIAAIMWKNMYRTYFGNTLFYLLIVTMSPCIFCITAENK